MTEQPSKKNKNIQASLILWSADLISIWTAVLIAEGILSMDFFTQSTRLILLLVTVAYIPTCWYLKPLNLIIKRRTLDKVFIDSFKSLIVHALVFLSIAAFLHVDYKVRFYVLLYGLLAILLPLANILCFVYFKRSRRKGHWVSRVAIVGTNETSRRLSEAMLKNSGFGYKIIGFFDSEPMPDFKGNYIGNFDKLEEYAREKKIDEVYFTLVGDKAEKMPRVVRICDNNLLNFYYVPKISHYITGSFQLNNIETIPILSLRRNPLSVSWRRGLKRAFDIAFSSVVLIASPIVFIPIAIGIKLTSPGPVFFRQERTGYKGKSFKCYKFRTMRVNADADKVQATLHDPRKTKFGSFLRRTNIDELPQFINVWLGDMSVVGPRPHMLKHTKDYSAIVDKYMVRHIVKPGITGWAQVNGYRGLTDELWKMEKRVEFDVWYIENWTFSLDLKIIFNTVFNSFKGEQNAF